MRKAGYESRRARFLKAMLDAFDTEDSVTMLNLANDEQIDFWPVVLMMERGHELSEADQRTLSELGKEFKRLIGRQGSSARMATSPQSLDHQFMKAWKVCEKRLSPQGFRALPDVLDLIDLGELECIDARYAHEVVEKLGKVVTRVGRLHELPPLAVPNASVQLAFEEAHRCYLYGFKTACAVLCRATIESSLRENLNAPGRGDLRDDRDLSAMLGLPHAKILLDDLWQFADEIRRAGNLAVHDTSAFEKLYAAEKMEEILYKTRKIVEHLYSAPNPTIG